MSLFAKKRAISMEELNSYSIEEFRNTFFPHHTETGWLYLNKPEKQFTEPSSLDQISTNDCVQMVDLSSENSGADHPKDALAKTSSTCSPRERGPPTFGIKRPTEYVIRFTTSANIEMSDLNTCLDLIALTSSADYTASSIGWSPTKKKIEMLLNDMKYLLWSRKEDSTSGLPTYQIEGFLSFMFTYEDDIPVIYCYEIHLEPRLQGRGIGRMLMEMMESVGCQAGVRKAMLTVFTRNQAARGCYERMGVRQSHSGSKLIQW